MRAIMQGLFLTGFVTQWITSVAFIESSSLRSFGLSRSKSKEALAVRLSARPDIPTVEQLSKDAFMQQVAHADALVHLLDENEDNEELGKLLKAQLSHSDGIRGFFVKYLTGDESPADKPSVPAVLQEAMSQVDANELIPLACMNVVMPTGMITMHEDPELSEQSKKTSERGAKILASLRDSQLVKDNCKAILAVATDESDLAAEADGKLVKYWAAFFEKWGYKEKQKKDIANVIKPVLES